MAERKTAARKQAAKKKEPEDVATRDGESLPVVVLGSGTWRCPFCDHAQHGDVTACQSCGAERGAA